VTDIARKGKYRQMIEIADEIDGWIIKRKHNNYDFVYIIFFVLHVLSQQPLPDPPAITYTLENKNTGAIRMVTLLIATEN
jgi:hypothetical protein